MWLIICHYEASPGVLLYLDKALLKRHWFELLALRKLKTFTVLGRPLWGLLEKLLTPTEAHVENLTCGASFLSEAANAETVPTSQAFHLCREHQDFPSDSSCSWHWNVPCLKIINGLDGFQRQLTKKKYFFGVINLLPKDKNRHWLHWKWKIFPATCVKRMVFSLWAPHTFLPGFKGV